MKIISKGVIWAAAALMSATAGAATLQHAEFAFDGQSIAKDLKASGIRHSGIVTTVYCQSVVKAIGAASETTCYNKEGNHTLAGAVAHSVNEQDFWPAHVNGRAVSVRVNYRVVVKGQDDKLRVRVLPNLGAMQAEYGEHYVAPQERLDEPGWYEYYAEKKAKEATPFFSHKENHVRVATQVKQNGTAKRPVVIEAERGSLKKAKVLEAGLRKASFIPGFVDGKPVEMPYMAVISYEE